MAEGEVDFFLSHRKTIFALFLGVNRISLRGGRRGGVYTTKMAPFCQSYNECNTILASIVIIIKEEWREKKKRNISEGSVSGGSVIIWFLSGFKMSVCHVVRS